MAWSRPEPLASKAWREMGRGEGVSEALTGITTEQPSHTECTLLSQRSVCAGVGVLLLLLLLYCN